MELATQYNPKDAEKNHYAHWEESGFFAPEINENRGAEKYSIVIPPPNVTGSLHMGHALQHTVMDVLARWKRMHGYRTLFLPGIDHAAALALDANASADDQLVSRDTATPTENPRR